MAAEEEEEGQLLEGEEEFRHRGGSRVLCLAITGRLIAAGHAHGSVSIFECAEEAAESWHEQPDAAPAQRSLRFRCARGDG
eukprot:SAG11_NODE_4613_length_1834_cov_4.598847_1_plen_81_part_00